ncbi:unnamed protein product [Effrenium voratum]|nr:unnamed protein product [Effrenium voratum]
MAVPGPHDTDLAAFHGLPVFHVHNPLAHGVFTKVRTLADAINGKVILYQWTLADGQVRTVAGKKMQRQHVLRNRGQWVIDRDAHRNPRDPRVPHPEDSLTEVGVLTYLRQQPDLPLFLLRMHDAFFLGAPPQGGPEEDLLVTEFVQGGEVFNHVKAGALALNEDGVRELMWQLVHAVRYLHAHGIAHRDISLENVLIDRPEPGCTARLMDFGQAVQTVSAAAVPLRFFRSIGKPYYRGPECYVPRLPQVDVIVPADAAPNDVVFTDNIGADGQPNGYLCEVRLPDDAVPGQQCLAEVWGYEARPLDVFSLGVCLFILNWRMPPWGQTLRIDRSFNYILANGIAPVLAHWKKEPMSAQVAANPARRLSAEECLQHPWFQLFDGRAVPTHP